MKRLSCIGALLVLMMADGMAQDKVSFSELQEVRGFSEGLVGVKQHGKWGFVDEKGNIVVKPTYLDIRDFHEGKAAVKTESGWGYIDRNNLLVIPCKYYDARDFSEGMAAVKTGKNPDGFDNGGGYDGEYRWHYSESVSWQYIKADGTMAFPGHFRDVSTFHDGVACVFVEKHWYFIDKKGASVFTTSFDNYYPVHYSDGLIPNVGGDMGDEWGYSDLSGTWVVQPQYRSVSEFCDGIAVVEEFGGNMKVVDSKGDVLFDGERDRLVLLKGGYVLDGNLLYHKDDFTSPRSRLNRPENYWHKSDVVTIPSSPPAGYSVTVGGFDSSLDQYDLAILCYNWGKHQYLGYDYDYAFVNLTAAATNEANPIPQAMTLLAGCYEYGLGTDVDMSKARYWREEAAKYDDEDAQRALTPLIPN